MLLELIVWLVLIFSLLLFLLLHRMYKRRYYYNYYDEEEEEDERLLGTCMIKKTSTFYQWNRSPPTSSCPIQSQTSSWEERRSVLLKKYAAIES